MYVNSSPVESCILNWKMRLPQISIILISTHFMVVFLHSYLWQIPPVNISPSFNSAHVCSRLDFYVCPQPVLILSIYNISNPKTVNANFDYFRVFCDHYCFIQPLHTMISFRSSSQITSKTCSNSSLIMSSNLVPLTLLVFTICCCWAGIRLNLFKGA